MKIEHINPFIASTNDVFTTMLAATVTRGQAKAATSVSGNDVLLAVIGLSGDIRGAVAVAFPFQTAVNMTNRVLGTDKDVPDEDVADTVAEITNMIAGGAKAHLSHPDATPVQLGLPVIIRETSATLDYPARGRWVELPFTSDLGPFTINISFEEKISA